MSVDAIQAESITNLFHGLYYGAGARTWANTFWLGVPAQKCPLDLWVYQEILFEQRPDLIVETGTADGGSALFLASVCDLLGHGEVLTIDIVEKPRPAHRRITYVGGSSTAAESVRRAREAAAGKKTVMVILDSDHARDHVLQELRLYAGLVTPGAYLIVEDSNVNGHPVLPEHGPGPMEALREFLGGTREFAVDAAREKFFLTFNPKGFLKKLPKSGGLW